MPIMRDTPPPLPADVLRDLRATLPGSYGHRLVSHEGRLVLAVRVPSEVPDREADLERAADYVPEEEVSQARDVLLIGEAKLVRLDPIPLRDAVRERLRDDLPVSKEVRRGLPREYGAALFNPATRRDWCVAVRVPRGFVRDVTPEDLGAVQKALEQVLAQPKAAQAAMCYLVADNDYRRGPPEEFARLLRGEVPLRPPRVNTYAVADGRAPRAHGASAGGSPFGMLVSATVATDARLAREKKPAAPLAPASSPPAAPVAAPSAVAPAPPAVPATLPLPPGPEPTATLADPVIALGGQLAQAGFEVLTDVADLGLQLAAHQPDGKRLIVRRVPEATAAEVRALAGKCAELEAHVGVLLADRVAPGAWLEAAGTCVELLPAGHAETWAP